MNRIYWDKDSIGIVTDHIDAALHSHPVMQLFLSIEGLLDIEVSGEMLSCRCVVVEKDILHAFNTKGKPHFSLIIPPTTELAEQLCRKMNDLGYLICDRAEMKNIQQQAQCLVQNHSVQGYQAFMKQLLMFLGAEQKTPAYDDRITELLSFLDECSCDDHAISQFAYKVALSPSRLSHLFKEQTGVPLKSYITLHQMERAFIGLLGGKSVTEAALNAGFDTPSHFAATTKRLMGMSASLSLKDSEFLKVSDL